MTRNPPIRVTALALAAALAGSVATSASAATPASAEGDTPFAGTWDCEVTTFTFTPTTYSPDGDEVLEIRSIEREDHHYELAFDDDYRITLSMADDGTMGWFSHASGDSFTCTRLDG